MVKCCAPKCSNASYNKTPEITLHRFPKDVSLRNIWIRNINRKNWQPNPSSVLCSKHFEDKSICRREHRTVLIPGAIPTIFEEELLEENKENAYVPMEQLDFFLQKPTAGSALHEIQISVPAASGKQVGPIPSTSGITTSETLTSLSIARSDVLAIPSTSGVSYPAKNILEEHEKTKDKIKIKSLQHKTLLQSKKIKALKQQNRRLKIKVSKLSDVISSLKEKLDHSDVHILSSIPISNKEFFTRYLKKAKQSSVDRTYSPELRAFALQLHFYSPRAYNFVRESFNTVLPHPGTLHRWYKKVDAEPGYTSESFDTLEAIAKTSNRKVFVNMSIDEMAIRKGLVWDGTNNKFRGHVDTGTDVTDDSLPLATQALVILVTALNFNWVLPIGYFFISAMTGVQRASIVKMAIEMLYNIEIFVCGLTFDGAASNISMATYLGCDFSINNLKPNFMFKNVRVNVFYDPCHMVKLIRNTFGEYGILIDKDNSVINFGYLSLLHDLQTEKGLHLANKLKEAHILFSKQKMKVRLATQLFSKSVADALSFCETYFEEFKGCAATVKFINIINDVFDVLNSRSTLSPGYKKAMCAANIEKTKELVRNCREYFTHLKLSDGKYVLQSARKTGFIGFIISLTSALNLFEDLVHKEKLRFLSVYKISQDFLEMFFGKMRARGGFNDNPNIIQFRTAYKKNLIKIKLKLQSDGFKITNPILTASSKPVEALNKTTPSFEQNIMTVYDLDEEEADCFLNDILSSPLDEYSHHVTIYIAGFIARKVIKAIHCYICQMLVIGEKSNFLCSLIDTKNRGGLLYPSKALIKIIQTCEKCLKMFKLKGNINYNSLIMYINENTKIDLLQSSNEGHDSNHVNLLVQVIVKFYVNLRSKHDAKQSNLSDRNYLKKIVLFKNK